MTIDLLLVNPSARRKIYHDSLESFEYPALEPPYLAALTAEFIRNHGYNVSILDANVENLSTGETVSAIKEVNPKLTQIVVHGNQPSASTQLMGEVGAICRGIKDAGIDTKILLTGTHPSALPKRTLEEEVCDFVGRGEGFNTPLGILRGGSLSEVPGLWYREGEKILSGQIDKLFETQELGSALPKAAWDLLKIEKYRAHNWHCLDNIEKRQPYASIYTSFGCCYNCIFCCINAPFNEGGKVRNTIRYRAPEKIVEEIGSLVENHGVRNLKIIDELFVFNPRHYLAIAKKLIERGYNLNIWAYARVSTIKEKNLEILKKAGFNWLALGIESGSEHVRNEAGKRISGKDIHKVVAKIKKFGISVIGNYMFGLPNDDEESMRETFELSKELNCEFANFYCTMAYPGSKLHTLAGQREIFLPAGWDEKKAVLPEEDKSVGWVGYSQHSYYTLPLPTKTLYPKQVLEFRDNAFVEYFRGERYISMIRAKFGQEAVEHISKMNLQKIRRKILEK